MGRQTEGSDRGLTPSSQDHHGSTDASGNDDGPRDLRHAARLLAREPGYAAVALLGIALGIGATTTLFSVVYGVLLKPLPWPEPERLVRLVLSYSVVQRTREIGVRTALGATTGDIVSLVMRSGLTIVAAGVAGGIAAGALLVQSLSKILYGVRPFDPLTFVIVPAFLVLAAAVAYAAPARRAARIDPLRALRTD